MDEAGNTREDLSLPKGTEELDKVADQIKEYYADGREMVVTVLKVPPAPWLLTSFLLASSP